MTPSADNFMFQLVHTYRPGSDGHLAGFDRQHQQSAHDERGLQPRPAARAWRSAGARETLAGGELNNKQFNDFVASGPLTRVLREAGHGLDAARAEGRLRFRRRAGRAQSRLSQHRPVQRGMAAAFQRRSSAASRSRPIEIAVAEKNSTYWQATEAQTPDMALFFLQGAAARIT